MRITRDQSLRIKNLLKCELHIVHYDDQNNLKNVYNNVYEYINTHKTRIIYNNNFVSVPCQLPPYRRHML